MHALDTSVKKNCGREFTEHFRAILYSPLLSWGAKCLAFAIDDSPGKILPKLSVLARRLESSPSQVSIWFKELVRHKFVIRLKKTDLPLE